MLAWENWGSPKGYTISLWLWRCGVYGILEELGVRSVVPCLSELSIAFLIEASSYRVLVLGTSCLRYFHLSTPVVVLHQFLTLVSPLYFFFCAYSQRQKHTKTLTIDSVQH